MELALFGQSRWIGALDDPPNLESLQPHRAETFKLSTDPLFVEKLRDIVGLYLSPAERAIVLCVDEKSQIQACDGVKLPERWLLWRQQRDRRLPDDQFDLHDGH